MFYDAQLKAHSHFLTKHIWLFPPSLLFILGMTDSMFFIPFSCHHGLAIWLLWISYDNYISIKLARSFSTWQQIVFQSVLNTMIFVLQNNTYINVYVCCTSSFLIIKSFRQLNNFFIHCCFNNEVKRLLTLITTKVYILVNVI